MTFLETAMRHFKAEEWSDYVRGSLAPDSAEAMREREQHQYSIVSPGSGGASGDGRRSIVVYLPKV